MNKKETKMAREVNRVDVSEIINTEALENYIRIGMENGMLREEIIASLKQELSSRISKMATVEYK